MRSIIVWPLVAAASIAAAPAPRIVLPLNDKEMSRIEESGCEYAFNAGPATYVFAINNRMMVKTPAGAKVCGIDGSLIDAFFEGERTLSCGGVSLAIARTGRRTGNSAADSVSGPARLTATVGSRRQLLRGEAGTAC